MAIRKTEIKKDADGEEIVESVRAVPGDKYSDDFEICEYNSINLLISHEITFRQIRHKFG